MAFSVGPVKQIEVEDMDYTYGDANRFVTYFLNCTLITVGCH